MKLCNAEALTARAGLSTGALVAILLCVIILLSEWQHAPRPHLHLFSNSSFIRLLEIRFELQRPKHDGATPLTG